jgi:hypothetical protein
MKALSVRQPWAWAIIYAGKDIENRSENMASRLRKAIGQTIYIHAGKTVDMDGMKGLVNMGLWERLEDFLGKGNNIDEMNGGIVGTVRIVDVVTKHRSKWFTGPCGIVLADPKPVKFQPGKGQLGLFEWSPQNPNPR